VAITAVALVPLAELGEGDTPLLKVVEAGAPGLPLGDIFPFIAMFAVANSALINMLMASRLVYGMARRRVLPWPLGKVHPRRRTPWVAILFTTLLAVVLITVVGRVAQLGGTTALLLLMVFTIVNIAVLVLRRDPVEHDHFRTPTPVAVLGALCCAYLVTPLSGRPSEQYAIAGVLLALGLVLWVINWALNTYVFHQRADVAAAVQERTHGPVN
jgi:APA family basic amino acid/polyamine antiporter